MWGGEEKYADRSEAGRALASELQHYHGSKNTLILALPRGGVPVAFELSRSLNIPMDVFLVRKLGVPGHEEYAMGAIASGGFKYINQAVVEHLGLSEKTVEKVIEQEEGELARREIEYGFHNLPTLQGQTVILVDDGVATGSTVRVALQALREANAGKLVVAVPVGSADTCEELRNFADEIVCARRPEDFHAVGQHYQNFHQTSDAEVRAILDKARSSAGKVEVQGW